MKQVTNIALIIAAAAIVAVIAVQWGDDIWDKVLPDTMQEQVDQLEEDLRQSELKRVYSDSIIVQQEREIVLLEKFLDQSADRIDEIQKRNGKKIDIVGRSTPSQLDSFFTARYGNR